MLNTAAHLFRISEKTGRTPFGLLTESGVPDYPIEEIEKIAAVMTDKQIAEIVQRLTHSSDYYNGRMIIAQKDPSGDIFSPEDLLESCREFARRATLWLRQSHRGGAHD